MADKSTSMGSVAKVHQSWQEIANQGWDSKYNTPAFIPWLEDKSVSPNVLRRMQTDIPLTIAMEYSGENPIYIGKAQPGTAKSAALWQIQKLTYDGNNVTDVQWADGDTDYDNVWNNRDSLSYS